MSFERPWVLLFLLLPLIWAAVEYRTASRRAALILKAISFALVLLALSEPILDIFQTKVAAVVLTDTSASVSEADLDRASRIAQEIQRNKGRNWSRVMAFSAATRSLSDAEGGKQHKLAYTEGDAARATDLESAIREGMAALPAGMVPRVVLISDGNENAGSAARAAWQARQLGVPIDTYALAGRPKPALRLESASFPPQVFTGERFPIELNVLSPGAASARVGLTAGGKEIGNQQVKLVPGPNRVKVQAALDTTGAVDVTGVLTAAGLGELRFTQALNIRRPKLAVLTRDPQGTEAPLRKILDESGFDVRFGQELGDLSELQLVVLNNWDLDSIPAPQQRRLQEYVSQGGGLLVIGGENNIYRENKGPDGPLEVALPAKLAPPRDPEGTCVVLIIDKSSSMEGKKMELARVAAIGVIENLRPHDLVGVLIFDNSNSWTVPIRRAQNRSMIARLVAGITADGGTQIAPALSEAYKQVMPQKAVYKHIVLLTDGISEEGDSLSLAREAQQNQVTISTVGLGQDVNRAYLEKVALNAGGKSYFLKDPSGLEQILLKDVKEHTGSTAVERPVRAKAVREAEILEQVEIDKAPPLAGYVKYTAKPAADLLLTVDDREPLYVRWQYGLGRAAVFTSDAKSRWAASWVGWDGFGKLWANIFRDLLPRAQPGEASADFDRVQNELIVRYRLAPGMPDPKAPPTLFAFGPAGFQKVVPVTKLSAGLYQGKLPIGSRRGFFRVRALQDSRAFPEVGMYRQEEELHDYGSNPALLQHIAEYTGGRFEPAPAQIFQDGRAFPAQMRLWPALLALAVLMGMAELLVRKWPGVWQTLFARRSPAPQSAA